jgi:hypothetical protein
MLIQAGDMTAAQAVHDAEGARPALVADRRTAFRPVQQDDPAPVGVH